MASLAIDRGSRSNAPQEAEFVPVDDKLGFDGEMLTHLSLKVDRRS